MILLLTIIITTLASVAAQNRVIEITTSNVQLVLRTVDRLHLLLHDPNCPHSRDYAQKFLDVKTPLQMGIADCQREKELCSHLNVTNFPALVQLTSNTINIIDEQQFLLKEGLAQENDPKFMLNSIVGRLKGESGWAAVVLQQEGLPVLQRVGKGDEAEVFYVAPPSRLYSHLSSMVGRKMGCWILSNKDGQLKKYYCGNGYKSEELLKYLQNFRKDKLVSHTFTRQTNNTQMTQNQLAKIIKQNYSTKKCKLVYFYSKHCEHCSLSDVRQVENVLTTLKLKKNFQVQVYDLDYEELPGQFKLRRIPELIQFCNFEMQEFGDVFTIESLKRFLGRTRSLPKVQKAQTFEETPIEAEPQSLGSVTDERLEL